MKPTIPAQSLCKGSVDSQEHQVRESPLSPGQLTGIDAYWRAASYLSVGQIYLFDNPLLKEPLKTLCDTPLILAGPMWADLVEWGKNYMLSPDFPLASPKDFAIPQCCRDASGILEIVRRHHAQWQARREQSD
jgi:hypothetical protein